MIFLGSWYCFLNIVLCLCVLLDDIFCLNSKLKLKNWFVFGCIFFSNFINKVFRCFVLLLIILIVLLSLWVMFVVSWFSVVICLVEYSCFKVCFLVIVFWVVFCCCWDNLVIIIGMNWVLSELYCFIFCIGVLWLIYVNLILLLVIIVDDVVYKLEKKLCILINVLEVVEKILMCCLFFFVK